MSAALEARYRAALRWYPRAWRDENADAIIGTMLDQAEAEGRSTPLKGELRNLASSGVSQRVERYAPQVVRDRVAAIALAIGTAYALIMFVGSEWAPFATSGPLNDWTLPPGPAYREPSTVGFGPFASVLVIVYSLWIVATVAVLLRLWRVALAVLVITLPTLVWVRSLRFDDIGSIQPQTAAFVLLAGLALLAAAGRPDRLGRRVVAILVSSTVAGVISFMLIGGMAPLRDGRLWGNAYTFTVLHAPAIASTLVLAAVALAIAKRREWSTGSFVAAIPWLFLAPLYFADSTPVNLAIGASLAALSLTAAFIVWSRSARAATAPSSRSS